MKKLSFLAVMLLFANLSFGGGLLTNTNQSAQYIRMMSRNASRDIDAVYFNPAGLSLMKDGWHFAIYNQTIFQDKNVNTGFPLLNNPEYVGKVSVPAFPTAFAAFKKENWVFSFGFGPNGGGGSAEFERGLPSFEIPISKFGAGMKKIGPLMTAYQVPAVTGYDADLSFEGTSVFWGFQLGATYKLNEVLSGYIGVRVMPSKNTYYGEINDITLKTASGDITGSNYQLVASPVISNTINTLNSTSTGLQNAINAGIIDPNAAVTNPQILQILGLLGVPGATNQQAVGIMTQTSSSLNTLNTADVTDKKVDVEQTGLGFTPIIGFNINLPEDLNIGIKYEHLTKLNLENNTTSDDLGLFPNGAKSASDVPAILSVGIGYKGLDWLEAQLSYTGYFNKGVNWGMNTRDMSVIREIEKMGYELGLGLQFNLSEKFAVSVGGLMGDMGVADSYQSDFSYSNPSTTIGAGIMWKVGERLTLDAGFSDTFYKDQTVTFSDPDVGEYKDTYGKTTLDFAIGLSYSIF